MKILWVVMGVLVAYIIHSLYIQYSEVSRFQDKELQIVAQKNLKYEKVTPPTETGMVKIPPKTYALEKPDKMVELKQSIPIPEGGKTYTLHKDIAVDKPTLVKHESPPAWVQQSPFWIAVGLWIEMLKNLVTLILSFLTAMFMYWTYKREKVEVVEVIEE
jgi:hypothetical protein